MTDVLEGSALGYTLDSLSVYLAVVDTYFLRCIGKRAEVLLVLTVSTHRKIRKTNRLDYVVPLSTTQSNSLTTPMS
jgi:hypothetical protein